MMKNVLSIALMLVCFASAADLKSQMVGKWKQVGGPDRIEFRADGNFVGTITCGQGQTLTSVAGIFLVDGEKVTLGTSYGPLLIAKVKVTSETMELTYIYGLWAKADGSEEFRRVK